MCLSENLTLRESLQGYWKRVEVNRSNVEYLDSDEVYTVYNIFNNSINTFYSFRKNEFDKGYTLENHLISDINYIYSGIKKNSGKVLLGFEGMFSGEKTWKEVVESGGEVFSVRFSTKDRVTIFFSDDYSETYIKLDDGNLPIHLKDVLKQTSNERGVNMNKKEPKVLGIGGVFFKTESTEKTQKWYQENLGIVPTGPWGTIFQSRDIDNPDQKNSFVWSPHDQKTDYFNPSKKEFMINYRVQNIEDFVKMLKEKGVTILLEVTEYEGLGKFSHILDPDGNKIELWEPPKSTTVE